MYRILLTPRDVLFFRDARPMSGSLTGHTALWPQPNILNHALRSALHRAESGNDADNGAAGSGKACARKYGSLVTAGPFPVSPEGVWYLPVPADLVKAKDGDALQIGVRPVRSENPSSLPKPLTYALGATVPPAKDGHEHRWISAAAYSKYLARETVLLSDCKKHADIGDMESRIGIGIDPDTQAQNREQFYSAQYLRLRDGWRLGGFAEADDGKDGDRTAELLTREDKIIVGGQRGVCSLTAEKTEDALLFIPGLTPCGEFGSRFLKWTLVSPAVFPEIAGDDSRNIRRHTGGWLPNWIDPENGNVLLREPVKRQSGENRDDWRNRARADCAINGFLRAARIPEAVEISGWSLEYGEKPTQLAVPAGAVYYFECASADAARKLAAALDFPNRRSTLLGEKGFGFGFCAPVAEDEMIRPEFIKSN